MSFMICWLLVGFFTILVFTITNLAITDIGNAFVRRVMIFVSLGVCYPTFFILSIADHFIQWAEGDIEGKEALSKFYGDIGPGIFSDAKRAW